MLYTTAQALTCDVCNRGSLGLPEESHEIAETHFAGLTIVVSCDDTGSAEPLRYTVRDQWGICATARGLLGPTPHILERAYTLYRCKQFDPFPIRGTQELADHIPNIQSDIQLTYQFADIALKVTKLGNKCWIKAVLGEVEGEELLGVVTQGLNELANKAIESMRQSS